MTDYLNPCRIPSANSCVSCGAEMPEGDMVCPACVESWTIKADEHAIKQEKPRYFIGGRELNCDKAYDWFQEAINEKAEREKATTQESLQDEEKVRKPAEIIREGADKINRLMNLKIWLVQQIENETDETRLNTLKRMLEGVEI
jgi:uncharacterized Zn finger protein (UPF0148 family)